MKEFLRGSQYNRAAAPPYNSLLKTFGRRTMVVVVDPASSPTSGGEVTPVPTPNVRSCGCAHRFLPSEHSSPVIMLAVSSRHATQARNFWERRIAHPDVWKESDPGVWNNIYCTIRDRRRSRSRASSCSLPRSRTPSSVSSDRATPPPGPLYRLTARTMSEELLDTLSDVATPITVSLPPHKFKTTCYFEPCMVPTQYSSSIYIKIGSTKKRYVEEVNFKTRLVPKRFSESVLTMTTPSSRRYTSGVEIKCLPPDVTVFELEEDQSDLDEELDATQLSI